MSLLTRIFVSVLVVLSLFLSAATITFVSSIDDVKIERDAYKGQIASLQAELTEKTSLTQLETKAKDEAIGAERTAKEAYAKIVADTQKQLADLGKELADAKTQLTVAGANVSKQASALNALQASNTAYQSQIAEYRGDKDKLQTENGELNVALTKSQNELQVTEERRRLTAEQLTEIQGSLDKVSSALRDRGVDPNRITTGGLTAGAPPINGVVRATSNISGIPHAQISIGSEDAVKVGMEFKVIDRANGRFLGTLTVVAVEPNEAVGRLAGPNAAAIAAGAEVRTQL